MSEKERENAHKTVQVEFIDQTTIEVVLFKGDTVVSTRKFKPIPERYKFFLSLFDELKENVGKKGGVHENEG